MPSVAIALGSNLGDRLANLEEALRRMGTLGTVVAVSDFVETAPVGYLDQPNFLNGAVVLETSLGALELMSALLGIETEMGRVRVVAKGPRVVDLDLLLYGSAVIEVEGLTVPHPAMGERAFVLGPLAEVAGDWVHPVAEVTVGQMLAKVSEGNGDRGGSEGDKGG